MKDLQINIAGLGEKIHEFRYRIGKPFFESYGSELISEGDLTVEVTLDKQPTLLSTDIRIRGTVNLICDRSLEHFDHPLDIRTRILFKYAETAGEISEDIIHITRETVWLELGPVFYDLIGSSLPMKKLHPRFAGQEADNEEGSIIYRSQESAEEDDQIDPRWEKLRKLK